MSRVAAALVVLLSACGGHSDTIESDLAAASEIIHIPASAAEPIGRDRYGFTNPNSEATLDVFEVAAAGVDRFEVFQAPRADPIEFVRNAPSLGALANVLEPAESVVVILIPLLDPTRDFRVDFDARFISLDGSGSVVAADYPDATIDRLGSLFDFGRGEGYEPAESLAITAQGINSDVPSPIEDQAVTILLGD